MSARQRGRGASAVATISAMMAAHYVQIQTEIGLFMAEYLHRGGAREVGATHAVLAVDLQSKIGPTIISATGLVPPGHRWGTDMPALIVGLGTARVVLRGPVADVVLSRRPRDGHIHVLGIGDASVHADNDMTAVCAEWPLPELRTN